MQKSTILLSFILAMILITSLLVSFFSTILDVFPGWSFVLPFSTGMGFLGAIIVVFIEIFFFAITNKKKLQDKKNKNEFYVGRIVNTIASNMNQTILYYISVDVETETTIYHLSKIFNLNEEQYLNFEAAIKERKIDSIKVYEGDFSSLSFEFDFDDFYQMAHLNNHPAFIELKPIGSSMSKTEK